MTTLTQQIKNIDLPALLESEGIEVTKKGSKYFACCPNHNEKTASFCIYSDGHAKCFGCGWYGDGVDFLQELHGLTFKEALQRAGIQPGPMTADMRKRIAGAERKRKEKQASEQRRRDLLYTLAVEIRRIRKLIANIETTEDMESAAELFHRLPYLEHCWDILFDSDRQDAKAVMDALKGLKLINRKPLFKPDFDYRQWLRDFENGRINRAI
jgi:hypothetical protein